ncbi:MAG: hypothetical protein ICV60_19885 [Pyrinomonadaceae bacterium]|nr:hypothetical protein [Pyrinomonadaceae bacterium]
MNRSQALQTCLLSFVILAAIIAPSKCFGQKRTPAPDNYADLGDAEDEKFHDLRGWGAVNAVLPKGMSRDITSRYQNLRASNSVKLFVSQVGTPYNLTFRAEAGLCDDSFEVYVNNTGPLYVYRNKESSPMKALHQIRIDASIINDTTVEVSFRNIAEDSCGRAAISYVSLEPLAETFQAQQLSTTPARINLQRAMETVELFADREKITLASYTLTEARLVSGDEGEQYWRLRWENNNGKPEDYLEFTVSMDGLVTYRLYR